MQQIETNYLDFGYSVVSDIQDFYKTGLTEIPSIRSLISGCSGLFKIPQRNISLAISRTEGKDKVYRLGIEDPRKGVKGMTVGEMIDYLRDFDRDLPLLIKVVVLTDTPGFDPEVTKGEPFDEDLTKAAEADKKKEVPDAASETTDTS